MSGCCAMPARFRPSMGEFGMVLGKRDGGMLTWRCRAITLTKNSQFFVRQGDVERLIAQGYLQKLG